MTLTLLFSKECFIKELSGEQSLTLGILKHLVAKNAFRCEINSTDCLVMNFMNIGTFFKIVFFQNFSEFRVDFDQPLTSSCVFNAPEGSQV